MESLTGISLKLRGQQAERKEGGKEMEEEEEEKEEEEEEEGEETVDLPLLLVLFLKILKTAAGSDNMGGRAKSQHNTSKLVL